MQHGHVTGNRRGSHRDQAWYKVQEEANIRKIEAEWQAKQQAAQGKAA